MVVKRSEMDHLLRQLDPALDAEIPAADSLRARSIRRAALERGRQKRHDGRRLVTTIAAFVLLSVGTAAAVVIMTREPAEPEGVLCYETADLDGRAIVVTPEPGFDASLCAGLWQDGTFASGSVVPPLTACVNPNGGLAVFPGTDTVCDALGLARPTDLRDLDTLIELRQRLAALTPPGSCAPLEATVTGGEAILRDLGLDAEGWEVIRPEPSEERPCASWSINAKLPAVVVVGLPDVFGS